MNEKVVRQSPISISMDGVWAGSGQLRLWSDDSVEIVDCGAQFCDDSDASIEVYDLIQYAIEAGDESITVLLDGTDHTMAWNITPPLISANDMFLHDLTTALSQHDDVTNEFIILELLRAVVQLSDELTSDDDMGDLGIVAFDAIVDAALAAITTAISATR